MACSSNCIPQSHLLDLKLNKSRRMMMGGSCCFVGISSPSFSPTPPIQSSINRERVVLHRLSTIGRSTFSSKGILGLVSKPVILTIPRSSGSSNSNGPEDATSDKPKTPFGYSRKDVLLIGLGVTAAGIVLKSGLEYFGVDPLQAGNVVQLVLVLGLTIGWISTYIFRVSNKEMTYAQQLRDYESKVMEKRLEGLTEAELEALLEQVDEEKRRLASGKKVN